MSEHINTEGNRAEGSSSTTTATGDRTDIAAGIRQTLPVGMGLIPLGLAFGLLIAQTGFCLLYTSDAADDSTEV